MLASDIINMALTFLSLRANTIVAGLPSGGGENDQYQIDSATQLLLWGTEGQNRLARVCLPIFDSVNATPASAGASTLGPYNSLMNANGRTLNRPYQLFVGGLPPTGRQLQAANMGFLNTPGNFYPPTPWGDPTAWADNGQAAVLSQYTTDPTFTFTGYFLPSPLSSMMTPADPIIDDFAARTIGFYVAWQVALKNMLNTTLAARIQPMFNEFSVGVRELYARLIGDDPTLAGMFTPVALNSMAQVVKQTVPKT